MEIFKIEFSHYSYNPGEQVTGAVLISTSHEIPAHFLKLKAIGRAHTEWMEEKEQKKHKEKLDHSADFTYLSVEILLWSSQSEEESSLPSGDHTFPFTFHLPEQCPPSFEGFFGNIRYYVLAELSPDYRIDKRIQVVPIVHLNLVPGSLSPMISFVSKNTGLLARNGMVFMTATLPKQFYTPREVIPILISIENCSKKSAIAVMARMIRNTKYTSSSSSSSPSNRRKSEEIATAHRQISIPPKSKGQLEMTLKVPCTVSTFQSELISVDYCIQVKLGTMSLFGSSLSCDFNVKVGNVPRRTTHENGRILEPSEEPPGYPELSGLPPSYEEAVQQVN